MLEAECMSAGILGSKGAPEEAVDPSKFRMAYKGVKAMGSDGYFQHHMFRVAEASHARHMQLALIRQPSASGTQPTCLVVVGLTSWIHTPLFVSVEAGRTEQIMSCLAHRALFRALPLLDRMAGGKDQRSRRCRGRSHLGL